MSNTILNYYRADDASLVVGPPKKRDLQGKFAPILFSMTSSQEMSFRWDYYDGNERKVLTTEASVKAETFKVEKKGTSNKVSFEDVDGYQWSFKVERD
jgi:hypothetical protein